MGKLYDIPRGITRLDITGDEKPEMLLKALRENNNAHSYDVTLLIEGEKTPSLIGIEEKGIAHELISTADNECSISHNRLLLEKRGHPSILITASRILAEGQDLCAAVPVSFRFFTLTENREDLPGAPRLYFKLSREWTTEKKYEDVASVFKDNEQKLIYLTK